MAKKPTIRCAPNGPYMVEDLEAFSNSFGDKIPVKPTMALCRCGASKNKPFCDGSHDAAGFNDEKCDDREEDRRDTFEGDPLTIFENVAICSHAGYCPNGAPDKWRPKTDTSGYTDDDLIGRIRKCPSGALSHETGGIEHRDHDRDPAIRIAKNGPYEVQGWIELENAEWAEGASKEHFTLCRCGASKNKPFCDGSHDAAEFEDDEALTRKDASTEKKETKLTWHRVGDLDVVPEGRVMTVQAGNESIALTQVNGKYAAISNHCPHQGGPLGEGTIEEGVLRCPWHGWDFDPLTGDSKDDHCDGVATFACETREDGIYVGIEEPVHHRTISDVMAETMVNWGVDAVFGIVGGSNLGIADALRLQAEAGKLRFFGVRHEGAAAFAASGYAKLTGRPAACLAIAGPGSTNLLTGLWDAKVDRAPVLALSGQVQTQVFGTGIFQDIDLASAFQAVSRFGQTVLHDSRPAELMNLALKTAIVERDVSHLVFPDEVQTLRAGDGVVPGSPEGRLSPTGVTPPAESVEEAIKAIRGSQRPLIIVGYGALDGMDAVIRLAERLHAPIVTTFKAKGQIADDHPLAGGVLGRSGTPIASWLMNEADLLIACGASFAKHTGIDKMKEIVQIDFDRMALGKFHPVKVPVWGEIGITADRIAERLPSSPTQIDQRPDVAKRWDLWREEKTRREKDDRGKGVNSASIFAALNRCAPEDAVISVDVGNNTYSFGRYFEAKRQRILMSGYLGSIGFGFPGAMGAWAANTGRPIIAVTGDGGFGQYLAEFTTAVQYGMNITHLLLNNGELGKISKEQRAGDWPVWQTSLHNPDFAEFARNCGGHGIRVTEAGGLDAALMEALAYDGPALVEVMADVELI